MQIKNVKLMVNLFLESKTVFFGNLNGFQRIFDEYN